MTYREHMAEALKRCGFSPIDSHAILMVADEDSTIEIITGGIDQEYTDSNKQGRTLLDCWSAVKTIARGDTWKQRLEETL